MITDHKLSQMWRDAIIEMMLEQLREKCDDQFVADTAFCIGMISDQRTRRAFMDAVFTACEFHQMTRASGVGVRDVNKVYKMMRDEYEFAIRR
jgi:hypothetical protein